MTKHRTFWEWVDKTGDCWLWTGFVATMGYGVVSVDAKRHYVHRYAYEQAHGPIPKGLVIDHLCRTPLCVNPDHLEPVTLAENTRRGAAPFGEHHKVCKRGHDVTNPENVLVQAGGRRRRCKLCSQIADERRARPPRIASHCTRGHEKNDENSVVMPDGRRQCLICKAERRAEIDAKTHCKHGHRMDEANTYVQSNGFRRCRACTNALERAKRARPFCEMEQKDEQDDADRGDL